MRDRVVSLFDDDPVFRELCEDSEAHQRPRPAALLRRAAPGVCGPATAAQARATPVPERSRRKPGPSGFSANVIKGQPREPQGGPGCREPRACTDRLQPFGGAGACCRRAVASLRRHLVSLGPAARGRDQGRRLGRRRAISGAVALTSGEGLVAASAARRSASTTARARGGPRRVDRRARRSHLQPAARRAAANGQPSSARSPAARAATRGWRASTRSPGSTCCRGRKAACRAAPSTSRDACAAPGRDGARSAADRKLLLTGGALLALTVDSGCPPSPKASCPRRGISSRCLPRPSCQRVVIGALPILTSSVLALAAAVLCGTSPRRKAYAGCRRTPRSC